jgi:diguanylate cyclase (GGDEF)-like protein
MSTSHQELLALLHSASAILGRRLELSASRQEDERTVVSDNAAIQCSQPLTSEERTFLHDLLGLVEKQLLVATTFGVFETRVQSLEKENAELLMKNLTLSESSSRDALTGLFTRSYAVEKIEEEMSRAWRHGFSMSILMIDIDHLRKINQKHGTAIGDQVLKTVGQTIRNTCRVYDVPARFSGEQFCVMLPSTPVARTKAVAERIRHRIESRPVRVGEIEVPVTCSIGIAGLDNVPEAAIFNTSSLLERADRALYFAKDRGRNRVEAWSPALAAVRPSAGWEH